MQRSQTSLILPDCLISKRTWLTLPTRKQPLTVLAINPDAYRPRSDPNGFERGAGNRGATSRDGPSCSSPAPRSNPFGSDRGRYASGLIAKTVNGCFRVGKVSQVGLDIEQPQLSSFGSVASNRSARNSLSNAPARRCKAELCLSTSMRVAAAHMRHQFGIFAAKPKIRSRAGPCPAPVSHSASAVDEMGGTEAARVPQCANASAYEFGLRQFLATALDQSRMAKRDRRPRAPAGERSDRALGKPPRRFRNADPHRRGEPPAPPWDEGLVRIGVASRWALAFVAEEGRKAPLHVRLVVPAQGLVADISDRLGQGAAQARACSACQIARRRLFA